MTAKNTIARDEGSIPFTRSPLASMASVSSMPSVCPMVQIIQGDSLQELAKLPDQSVQCCVTSPPYYGLRDYGVDGQIGLESSPDEYVERLVAVFREVRRVLRDDGTLWLNLGDSYANDGKWGGHTGGKHVKALHCSPIGRNKRYTGLKPKDLIGIPWMVAFALREDGWYLRKDIIWSKPNAMPESVTDRPTTAHEYLFLLSKSERYHYDHEAIKEQASEDSHARLGRARSEILVPGQPPHRGAAGARPNTNGGVNPKARLGREGANSRMHVDRDPQHGVARKSRQNESFSAAISGVVVEMRNKRSVWTVPSAPYSEAHFATYPPDLIKPCILAGCPVGGTVLDPFAGSGTTGMVAIELGRRAILIELNPEYVKLCEQRCHTTPGLPLAC